MGIDTLGSIYFTGIIDDGGYFDTDTTIPASDHRVFFIANYDTAGNFQWLRQPQADTVTTDLSSTASKSRAIGLNVAPNGNVYVLSHLAPGIFGGTYATTANGFHLLQYNKDGTLIDGSPVDITVSTVATCPELRNLTDARTGFTHLSVNVYIVTALS